MATKKWSAKVTTVSTYPEHDLFNQRAKTVATHLASKKVSPEGPGQAMRMLNFYENRGGKSLSSERKRTLEHAKELLHDKVEQQREKKSSSKKSSA